MNEKRVDSANEGRDRKLESSILPWEIWKILSVKKRNKAILDVNDPDQKELHDKIDGEIQALSIRFATIVTLTIAIVGLGIKRGCFQEGEMGVASPPGIAAGTSSGSKELSDPAELTKLDVEVLFRRAVFSVKTRDWLIGLIKGGKLDPLSRPIVESIYGGWFTRLAEISDSYFGSSNRLYAVLKDFVNLHGKVRVYGDRRPDENGNVDFALFANNLGSGDFFLFHSPVADGEYGEVNQSDFERHGWFMNNSMPYYDNHYNAIFFPSYKGSVELGVALLPVALYDAWRVNSGKSDEKLNLRDLYFVADVNPVTAGLEAVVSSFTTFEADKGTYKDLVPEQYVDINKDGHVVHETVDVFCNSLVESLAAFVDEAFKSQFSGFESRNIARRQILYIVVRIILDGMEGEYKKIAYLKPSLQRIVDSPQRYIK